MKMRNSTWAITPGIELQAVACKYHDPAFLCSQARQREIRFKGLIGLHVCVMVARFVNCDVVPPRFVWKTRARRVADSTARSDEPPRNLSIQPHGSRVS